MRGVQRLLAKSGERCQHTFPNVRTRDALSASDVTSTLQDLLDAFLNGGLPPEAFLSKLSAYCNATPDSSWEVLSLLDQYHRRGKLSAEHFRAFRRKIEFDALGVPDPEMPNASAIRKQPAPAVSVAATTPAPTTDPNEVLRLRNALVREREKSRRYRHRIAKLAAYGRQQRVATRSCVMFVAPPVEAPPPQAAPVKAVLSAMVRFRRPRPWSSAAVLMAVATVITGSSSNLGHAPGPAQIASTPVIEAAPALPAAVLEPEAISLSSGRFVVFPGETEATIQVDRTGGAGEAASFKWWTQPAGAKSGKDYVGKSQIAQFEAGEQSVQLSVRILANPERKHTEMFYVAIGAPEDQASLGPVRRAAVFIMRP